MPHSFNNRFFFAMKSIRIFIKYLRKFLAGFAASVTFININSNSYPFSKDDNALKEDGTVVEEDLNLAINKFGKNNDRKSQQSK